jgi:type IV fimbrial biogenesis protein FimT
VPSARKSLGFSLVELMMGIMIMAILVSLAMPGLRDMLRNAEVRNAAEAVADGLQRARAEAVARNTNVEFVLGTEFVPGTGFVAGTASSWVVRAVNAPNPPIESRSGSEGSGNATVTALAADLPVTVPATFDSTTAATTVTFNNFGGTLTTNADGTPALARVDVTAPQATQRLRITIEIGGAPKMCDPGLAPGSSPRAC